MANYYMRLYVNGIVVRRYGLDKKQALIDYVNDLFDINSIDDVKNLIAHSTIPGKTFTFGDILWYHAEIIKRSTKRCVFWYTPPYRVSYTGNAPTSILLYDHANPTIYCTKIPNVAKIITHPAQSERGFNLVSLGRDVITCENYNKWYRLYYIDKDGVVNDLYSLYEDFDDVVTYDHSWEPKGLCEFAKRHNLRIGTEAYKAIVQMYCEECGVDYLGDASLPDEELYNCTTMSDMGDRHIATEPSSNHYYETNPKFRYYVQSTTKPRTIHVNACKLYAPRQFILLDKYCGLLYDLEGCACGGLAHVLIDDSNLDDGTIKFTLNLCDKESDRIEADIVRLICKELSSLTYDQRLAWDAWSDFEYYTTIQCCGDCAKCKYTVTQDY